jgi:hypothetical protein
LDLSAKRRSGGLVIHGDMKTAIVTMGLSVYILSFFAPLHSSNKKNISPALAFLAVNNAFIKCKNMKSALHTWINLLSVKLTVTQGAPKAMI